MPNKPYGTTKIAVEGALESFIAILFDLHPLNYSTQKKWLNTLLNTQDLIAGYPDEEKTILTQIIASNANFSQDHQDEFISKAQQYYLTKLSYYLDIKLFIVNKLLTNYEQEEITTDIIKVCLQNDELKSQINNIIFNSIEAIERSSYYLEQAPAPDYILENKEVKLIELRTKAIIDNWHEEFLKPESLEEFKFACLYRQETLPAARLQISKDYQDKLSELTLKQVQEAMKNKVSNYSVINQGLLSLDEATTYFKGINLDFWENFCNKTALNPEEKDHNYRLVKELFNNIIESHDDNRAEALSYLGKMPSLHAQFAFDIMKLNLLNLDNLNLNEKLFKSIAIIRDNLKDQQCYQNVILAILKKELRLSKLESYINHMSEELPYIFNNDVWQQLYTSNSSITRRIARQFEFLNSVKIFNITPSGLYSFISKIEANLLHPKVIDRAAEIATNGPKPDLGLITLILNFCGSNLSNQMLERSIEAIESSERTQLLTMLLDSNIELVARIISIKPELLTARDNNQQNFLDKCEDFNKLEILLTYGNIKHEQLKAIIYQNIASHSGSIRKIFSHFIEQGYLNLAYIILQDFPEELSPSLCYLSLYAITDELPENIQLGFIKKSQDFPRLETPSGTINLFGRHQKYQSPLNYAFYENHPKLAALLYLNGRDLSEISNLYETLGDVNADALKFIESFLSSINYLKNPKQYMEATSKLWNEYFAHEIKLTPEDLLTHIKYYADNHYPNIARLLILHAVNTPENRLNNHITSKYPEINDLLNITSIASMPLALHVTGLWRRSASDEFLDSLITRSTVNSLNHEGFNALHLAAIKDNRKIIAKLVHAGWDTGVKSSEGKNAFDYLKEHFSRSSKVVSEQYLSHRRSSSPELPSHTCRLAASRREHQATLISH